MNALSSLTKVSDRRTDLSPEHPISAQKIDALLRAAQRSEVPANGDTVLSAPVSSREKVKEAWEELVRKLFLSRDDGRERCLYSAEIESCASTLGIKGDQLVASALCELRACEELPINPNGRLTVPSGVGEHFDRVASLVTSIADVRVIAAGVAPDSVKFSPEIQEQLNAILMSGEVATLILLKTPPEGAALQIRALSDEHLNGLLSLWADPAVREKIPMSEALKDFLGHGTVRLLTTGNEPLATGAARQINEVFEKNGFEDAHWLRLIKGLSQDEKKEALKDSLRVCLPIAVGIKGLELVAPHMLHMVGGVLDDLFGAIIPDVSQSLGNKALPWKERLQHALPVLKGGLATLPVAVGCGWVSTLLYHEGAPWHVRAAAGATFALACCAGTLGTSVAAFAREMKGIERARSNPVTAEAIASLGTVGKLKLAFQNSILDVPFRVGHTVIGVPFQFALGIGAALTGTFHNSLFVMCEGMAETLLGAAAVFTYGHVARLRQNRELKRVSASEA